jgi:hypothetical protein
MYPYFNEEVAWQRLQDMQREVEYSRLLAEQGMPALVRLARWFGGRFRSLVAVARPVRRQDTLAEECESATDAA